MIIGHLIPAGTGSPHYQDTQPLLKDASLEDFTAELEIGVPGEVSALDEDEGAEEEAV